MPTFNEQEQIDPAPRIAGLWLFNLLPGVGNFVFTNRKSFTPPMILFLIIIVVAVPGFLKYLALYFTLSIAGAMELSAEQAAFENSQYRKQCREYGLHNGANKKRSTTSNFASSNFERKLRQMGSTLDIEPIYDPTRFQMEEVKKSGEHPAIEVDTSAFTTKAKAIDVDTSAFTTKTTEIDVDESAFATKAKAIDVDTSAFTTKAKAIDVDTSAFTTKADAIKVDTSAVIHETSVSDLLAKYSTVTIDQYKLPELPTYAFGSQASGPTGTSEDCQQCGEPRTHGYSFCPKCAHMF